MQCKNCKTELPVNANFCPQCGQTLSDSMDLQVNQKISEVHGTAVGTILNPDVLSDKLNSVTTQNVNHVETGGTLVGAIVGDHAQVGGQQYLADVVQGDKITTGDITNSNNVRISSHVETSLVQGAFSEEGIKAFAELLKMEQALPESLPKKEARAAIQGLEEEAKKGEDADENKVQKWFSLLAQMAPEIWEVAVNTFMNPIMGLSTVFKKVAQRAKQETEE